MLRKLIASAVLASAAAVLTATAQPPGPFGDGQFGGRDGKTKFGRGAIPDESAPGTPNEADSSDALVKAALANDADVRMAQAKLQLAEAELLKARQTVVLKVMTLKTTIEDLKSQVALLGQKVERNEKAGKAAALSDVIDDRIPYERAKSGLARAELELKLISGSGRTGVGIGDKDWTGVGIGDKGYGVQMWDLQPPNATKSGIEARYRQTLTGPIPARIRAALDKPVKLGAKGEKVTFTRALEIFKRDAGLDVPVRDNTIDESGRGVRGGVRTDSNQAPPVKDVHVDGDFSRVDPITSEGEELPVGVWFQVFADKNLALQFLVRDYGLLVTDRRNIPNDAIYVSNFWKTPAPKDAATSAKDGGSKPMDNPYKP